MSPIPCWMLSPAYAQHRFNNKTPQLNSLGSIPSPSVPHTRCQFQQRPEHCSLASCLPQNILKRITVSQNLPSHTSVKENNLKFNVAIRSADGLIAPQPTSALLRTHVTMPPAPAVRLERRCGLRKDPSVGGLLKSVRRRQATEEADVESNKAGLTSKRAGMPSKMPDVAVDAPPISSSDEEDDPVSRRGDIKPTKFGTKRAGGKQDLSSAKNSNAREGLKRSRTSARPAVSSRENLVGNNATKQPEAETAEDAASSPVSKKLKSSQDKEEQDEQPSSDLFPGFTKKTASKDSGSKYTYGKQKIRPVRPQSSGTESSKPTKAKRKPPSPKREPSPGLLDFKLPPPLPSADEDSSPPPHNFKDISNLDSPEEASPIRRIELRPPRLLPGRNSIDEESQRRGFVIPAAIPSPFGEKHGGRPDLPDASAAIAYATSLLKRADSSSPLSSPEPDPAPSICPLCRKEVDKALLQEFNLKQRSSHVTVSAMRRFCEQHQRRTARSTWVAKGYPDIQWDELDGRIARHYPVLRKILADEEPSHYRRRFEESVCQGRNRTLLTSDANLTPGYYGLRGLRAMTENLITEFAPLLRERAPRDRLVSARGYTTYLQSVLVPELAVRLIMEDMSVDAKEARTILAESSKVGELLNDEIADVVLEDSSSEEEEDGHATK
ncbi:hypothetical protein VTJ83DRAFT_302 [Remersonia thermophila]|uniref:Restriction of telomere capping protein 4 n=1 Tax=Remersonia thermophila TaxID=72144 RepID=A0ABR4DKM3_9PEZI